MQVMLQLKHRGSRIDSTSFDEFWDVVDGQLKKYGTAVHSRRYGGPDQLPSVSANDDKPPPSSIPELYSECIDATNDLPNGTSIKVPSLSWFRMQFAPKTQAAARAMQMTGRFTVKWKIQGHHLRGHHVDQYYGAKLYKFLRQLAVLLRDVAVFICQDDKKKVAVGEPGLPLAAANRTRAVMQTAANDCADHDFHKFNITPSVNLFSIIPDSVDGNWTDGPVYVHLKDSIYQQSSPWRHLAEEAYDWRDMQLLALGDVMRLPPKDRAVPAVILKYHDGGADHNITFASVQLAAIAEYLMTGADFYVSMRTVPQQSWTNPAERIMADINFGLQGTTAERDEGPEELEVRLRKCSSMAAIRKEFQQEPSVQNKISSLQRKPIRAITHALTRVHRNGEYLNVGPVAGEMDIEELQSIVVDNGILSSGFDVAKATKAALLADPCFKAFSQHCCRFSLYAIQIKKCGDSECGIAGCGATTMDSVDFKRRVHWLPLPTRKPAASDQPAADQPDQSEWYSFEELYGRMETSEADCPSLAVTKVTRAMRETDKINKKWLTLQTATGMIRCTACGKWRA